MAYKSPQNTVVFDTSKNEQFTINKGFKKLNLKLKRNWKILLNKEAITPERLSATKVFVLACPTEKFTAAEFDALRNYIETGGKLLVLLAEGGEAKLKTNINYFLEEYGVAVNSDSVVRTHFAKYPFFNPKEVFVSDGVLNRAISDACSRRKHEDDEDNKDEVTKRGLTLIYPFGATLRVANPSIPVLSSGSVSFPLNRPICAFYQGEDEDNKDKAKPKTSRQHQTEKVTVGPGKGKIVVLGSAHMFSDKYLNTEENSKLVDVIFTFLTSDDIQLNPIDASNPDVTEPRTQPQTAVLAEQPRGCLHQTEEIPTDVTTLFDNALYGLDTSLVPAVRKAYKALHVDHKPLDLMAPQLETPLPLKPAVFAPQFKDLPPPDLELFDLDLEMADEKTLLAQLTNKCDEKNDCDEDEDSRNSNLEYYVQESGNILGVTGHLASHARSAKHVLEYILRQVVDYKKLNQEEGNDFNQGGMESGC